MELPQKGIIDLEKLKGIDWYRQETDATQYFCYSPARVVTTQMNRPYEMVFACDSGHLRGYYSKDLMREKAEEAIKQEQANPGHWAAEYKQWQGDIRDRGEKLYAHLLGEDLTALSDDQLIDLHIQMARLNADMWACFYMEVFDLDAESLAERALVEGGITMTDDDRNTMMLQEQLIIHQQAERDLLRIARLLKSTPGAMNTLSYIQGNEHMHRLRLYPSIDQQIEEYVQRYFWMYNSYAKTVVMQPIEVIEQLKLILASGRDINAEYEQLDRFEPLIQERKQAIVEKYAVTDPVRQIFSLFGLLTTWRDARKAQMQKQCYWLEQLGTEVARRSGMTWDEISICASDAITSIPVSRETVQQYVDITTNRPLGWWDGNEYKTADNSQEAIDLIEECIQKHVTEVRGMIACPGKATGEVVVIMGDDDFDKMKDGAVLVTSMTRPEFVPLMKRAAGIVTDEGGITSHAAVVSRELKVPCVIGTQMATKMLNDGETVFVNADHGVVIVQENE